MSGCKITCFLDMALNYILPVKSWRLKPKLYWQAFPSFGSFLAKGGCLLFSFTLCTDWQKTDLGSMVSLSRLLPFCWLMLLAKSSVHLGGSSQGPQIAGQFAEHWSVWFPGSIWRHWFCSGMDKLLQLIKYFLLKNVFYLVDLQRTKQVCLPVASMWTGLIFRAEKKRSGRAVDSLQYYREWNL